MSRAAKIALALLLGGVAAGAIYLRGLHEQVLRLGSAERSEEQARRQVIQPAPPPAPSEPREKARIFWAAEGGRLEPVEVELALAPEPEARARLLMLTLIAGPLRNEARTLPADATLREFYLLDDGTAIADFSDGLARATPSGILSEQMALDSILSTLRENIPQIRRVKILINGQEADTLAGHVDLTEAFELRAAPPAEKAALTPSGGPGKLEPPK
jgi:hypothetical protein